ncbi:FAD/NAD(P)-binding domain-containing protein [Byssothecium circinans]|uniref:FAD/NAD(P)-binding domain-containing protein n=1 Tax=Byssothecium circinans TaxID=147558 RepID=A0A6A5TXI8_9PLEO|nr:FAD/NAD(P)-binding domain-containing protein [Byssothecium circinans]
MSPRPAIFDTLIIGGGPGGLAAALTFARLLGTAIVFDSSSYRNEGITHMHSVISRDHMDPYEFRDISREQITSRYETVWFEKKTIKHAAKKLIGEDQYDGFEVKDSEGKTYEGRKLILATGSKDVLPDIPGYKENWPQHIYQCLGCDGFEQRGTKIGVLDNSPMVAHFADMALRFDPRVTIFTNGPVNPVPPVQQQFRIAKAIGAKVDERKIKRLLNNGPTHKEGVTVEFEEGESVTLGFIAAKPPTVNRAQDLIEQLGVECQDTPFGPIVKITNPMFNSTSVRGVFAAGDTMAMMKQVTLSMADGMKAAAGVGFELAAEKEATTLKALGEEKI